MSDEATEARLQELYLFKERFPGVEVQEYCQRRLTVIAELFGKPPQAEQELLALATGWLGKDRVVLDGISYPRDIEVHRALAECAGELTAWVRTKAGR
jgi:hypothetical protein